MRIPAFSILFGVSMFLAADIPVDFSPVTPQILRGGALAILGGTVWYLLARTFPAFLAAQKDQRDAFLAHLEKRDRDVTTSRKP